MPTVQFSANFARQTPAVSCEVQGPTLREVMEQVFALQPHLRGYVLDDQATVRTHVVIFVNGAAIQDRLMLSGVVTADAEIYVMQALSGG